MTLTKLTILTGLLFTMTGVMAQMRSGITGVRDTGYTILNEYNRQKKIYPDITVAVPLEDPFIHREYDIHFCQTPERNLAMDIFSPADNAGRKRTAVLFIHGGGWRSGNKKMHEALLDRLVAKGYVCFAPEYRLSTEALYPAAIYDIKSAIRWIRAHARQYKINPDQIVVAGHSAGGELAAFAGATNGLEKFEGAGCFPRHSSRANAVIDLDGLLAFIHPESGEGDDSKRISAATYWFGYSKTENPGLWIEGSPLSYAGSHCPPILFINSGVARMHAGRDDYNRIMDSLQIPNSVVYFEGSPHSFIYFQPWFDSTVSAMDLFIRNCFGKKQKGPGIIKVAKDNSGQFHTINEAIRSVPANNPEPVTIFIRHGVYREKILIDSTRPRITLVGEDPMLTIITYDDHTGKKAPDSSVIDTRSSWTVKILADHFTARDITFRNDAGFTAGQAVAVESDGDKARFFHCRFIGNQDVLFTNNDHSRQYFEDCYIEGTTDFIFGSATAWFEKCRIYSKKNSHVTAAATPAEKEYGYIFHRCRLEGDSALHNVSLGRPWRPFAQVAYLESYIGPHIKAEGWSNWNNTDNYKNTRYAEYKNYGPSAGPAGRVSWSRQLSEKESKKITISRVFNGWNPKPE